MKNKKFKILIVDDEPIFIKMILNIFEKFDNNFETVVALNGHNALSLLDENNIDLVLLDVEMPLMNGYDLAKTIKEDKSKDSIPILFITSYTDESSIVKAYNSGGIDYVTKPFRPIELLARVKTHLRLASALKELKELKGEVLLC